MASEFIGLKDPRVSESMEAIRGAIHQYIDARVLLGDNDARELKFAIGYALLIESKAIMATTVGVPGDQSYEVAKKTTADWFNWLQDWEEKNH